MSEYSQYYEAFSERLLHGEGLAPESNPKHKLPTGPYALGYGGRFHNKTGTDPPNANGFFETGTNENTVNVGSIIPEVSSGHQKEDRSGVVLIDASNSGFPSLPYGSNSEPWF